MRGPLAVLLVVVTLVAGVLVVAPTAGAQTPTLYGGVDQTDIWLRVGSPTGPIARNLPAGTYTLRVSDTARNHNFRISAPGVDVATEVAEVYAGYREWTVTLLPGAYIYYCDAHLGFNGSFTVGDVISVQPVGPGSGSVTSAPAGVDCGRFCTAPFPDGTQVVLTAVAAPGSRFRGWSGACSGTDTCSVTVRGGILVGAGFDSILPPPPPPPAVSLVRTSATKARGERAVVVTLRVRRHATVAAALLRARRTVAAAKRHVAPGLRTVRLRVPRTARGGTYTVRVRVTADGAPYALTRRMTLPR